MAGSDPNAEWLGHVQPIGLVVEPTVLALHNLFPQEQTRLDTDAVKTLLTFADASGQALTDPWVFFQSVLGWQSEQVAGAPGGALVPDDLSRKVEESDTDLAPTWAVSSPDGGWQLLVRIEEPGIEPEKRGALDGWEATPHQRLERLLRETEVSAGILLTDNELRFVYAPRGETSGWLRFPLRSLGEVGGRPMLGGLKLILSSFRLHNDTPAQRLPSLLKASRDAQAEVSTKLAGQVLGALHELLRGLHAADVRRIEALAATRQDHLYDGLLTVLLRLVFLLYAEDRDLVPSRTDAAARAFYHQGYGVRTLHARLLDNAAHYPDTMDERRGAWAQLLALFRLIHKGDGSGWIKGRGGKLFDPAEFPFLQGQDKADDAPVPAPVSDGTILRILDKLLTLDGEKLSYRTLDVEQIGSVYETVMGFEVDTRAGPALSIRAGKNDRTPVFVDVAALAATKGSERAKFLKEKASRNTLPEKVSKALLAATDETAALAALRPIVDERGSPGAAAAPAGTPLLQPNAERQRTGSHYTPRTLTQPIVKYALEPAFERLGPDARPEQILDLKVCDPAMGSGAFLVEACRALGERLVRAWARWPETRPTIPPDEDELLHAKRLVAQRCLYGVDKNPRAVDLAKLSLWLATLAREHEFTFLDHALKCGDSLVGLTKEQIAAATWDEGKPGLPLFRKLVADRVAEAQKKRAEIQTAPDDAMRVILEAKHRDLETVVSPVRTIGDAVLSAFFVEDKSRAREKRRAEIESWISGIHPRWDLLEAAARKMRQGEHPTPPFHWPVEFPEVFGRDNSGFDAVVGNPPFMRGKAVGTNLGASYRDWLRTITPLSNSSADIVAFFFRTAFSRLRMRGALGLIATKTISEGDTRRAGLRFICTNGGLIYRAIRRLPWPGSASVSVSTIHVAKGSWNGRVYLDGVKSDEITAFLFRHGGHEDPARLAANSDISFNGCAIAGVGFTFDDTEPRATSIAEMRSLIAANATNEERIFPFVGGDEINGNPTHAPSRYVIFFNGMSLSEARQWPDLLGIVQAKVKPERDKANRPAHRSRWWQFGDWRPGLFRAIAKLDRMLAVVFVSQYQGFVWLPTSYVVSHNVGVFANDSDQFFCVVQSRVHEYFATDLSSGLEERPGYRPSDGFDPFPFPPDYSGNPALAAVGGRYYSHRARVMIDRNEGLTKTYNRFHDRGEHADDIETLRRLHAEMDAAVLTAYGWDDLAQSAKPEFIEQDADEGKKSKTRLDWPAEFKDEVLARLLALNAERAAAEKSAGLIAVPEDEAIEEEADA